MRKIPTLFERDWEGNHLVINKLDERVGNFDFSQALPTEKLDGTNVWLSVRNRLLVRIEKRRNPTRKQKELGIVDPWYVDVWFADKKYDFDVQNIKSVEPGDQYIIKAIQNTDFSTIPDGDWLGEVVGPKIAGNPLNLEQHTVFLFSVSHVLLTLAFENVPLTYNELKNWLPNQKSKFGNNAPIEGVVWHGSDGRMVKIKVSDFYR